MVNFIVLIVFILSGQTTGLNPKKNYVKVKIFVAL